MEEEIGTENGRC